MYGKAYWILASLIDRSVNHSYSEEAKENAHRAAYLFKYFVDEIVNKTISFEDYRWKEFSNNSAAINKGAVEFIKEQVVAMKVAAIVDKF
jgi:hypothetical protein